MEIPYVSRSGFLSKCEETIREYSEKLNHGEPVEVTFDSGGYPGRVIVTISDESSSFFRSDWESSDSSRFPARIKAAATALFNCGCRGIFLIEHNDGLLVIRSN